ncbi:MAG: hypothetical protein JXJ04_26900 [Spirochaetales bacterium]|nr:hypothetical protein [Spirochaetales bacterium]
MLGKTIKFTFILVLMLMITGCDSFSLLDQFEKTEDNSLKLIVQNSTLKPGGVSLLYPGGGEPPYSYAILIDNLYDDGHPSDPGFIMNQRYTAGFSIGKVKIHLTDNAGNSVDSPVTILPWKPQNFIADGTVSGPQTVTLTWDYFSPGYIGGFRILRSYDGRPFEEIATIGSLIRTYPDKSANPQMNYYRIYAVAGIYASEYAEASGMGSI